MAKKLYVGNLSFQTTSQDLQALFGQAGTVESASVIQDRDTGQSKGLRLLKCRPMKKRRRRLSNSTVKNSMVAC